MYFKPFFVQTFKSTVRLYTLKYLLSWRHASEYNGSFWCSYDALDYVVIGIIYTITKQTLKMKQECLYQKLASARLECELGTPG